jgi:hypothetical protein
MATLLCLHTLWASMLFLPVLHQVSRPFKKCFTNVGPVQDSRLTTEFGPFLIMISVLYNKPLPGFSAQLTMS